MPYASAPGGRHEVAYHEVGPLNPILEE